MGMDSAKVANSSNRNLQSSIGRFPSTKVKPETRKIRDFPTVHPKEAAAFRENPKRGEATKTIKYHYVCRSRNFPFINYYSS